MMPPERKRAEIEVLNKKVGISLFQFCDESTSNPYVAIAARTNRGNIYTIRIYIRDFPNSRPRAFVTKMLKTKNGENMDSASHSMHTLTSEYGFTQICHYAYDSWKPNVSLFKVFIKCRLWLEMYEEHLATGNPINHYLHRES